MIWLMVNLILLAGLLGFLVGCAYMGKPKVYEMDRESLQKFLDGSNPRVPTATESAVQKRKAGKSRSGMGSTQP